MLPSSWKPIDAPALVRLGSANDGGYLVSPAAVERATLLLSMGLNDDWAFEEDFLRHGTGRVVCFDHSVNAGFWRWYALNGVLKLSPKKVGLFLEYRRFFASPRAEHRQLKIGYDEPGGVSLATLLTEMKDSDIFLKMDIEGSEYRVLDDVVAHAGRFSGMAIEFHDVDLHRDRISAFLQALKGFRVVELHGNNFGGLDPAGDPLVIEVSLTRADLVGGGAGTTPLPSATPCDAAREEILLRYAPEAAVAG